MRICLVWSLLLGLCAEGFALPTNAPVQPAKFSFHSGGMRGWQTVKWDGKALVYEKSEHSRVLTNLVIKPSDQQWREFWTATEKMKLSKWQRNYLDPEVLDGWAWSIEITHRTQVFNTSGCNATPDDQDVRKTHKDIRPSKRFNEFKVALESLLGFKLW